MLLHQFPGADEIVPSISLAPVVGFLPADHFALAPPSVSSKDVCYGKSQAASARQVRQLEELRAIFEQETPNINDK